MSLCGEDNVGARDEAAAAAEHVAVHAGDDRSRARVERLQHLAESARVLDVLLVAQLDRRAHPLDVGAGAEALALAGQHNRARVADVGERVAQRRDQVGVERVPAVRSCERDAEDAAVAFDAEVGHGREA